VGRVGPKAAEARVGSNELRFRCSGNPTPGAKQEQGCVKHMTEERKNILRLFGTDIPGDLKIRNALRQIKGISFSTSKAILSRANINPDKIAGDLDDEEIESIKNNVENNDLPSHLLNRRKDPETGEDKILPTNDLKMQKREDIESMKKLGSYRGIRHRHGLPVRGQRTRSSFRGESSVGVATEKIKKEQESGE